MKNIPDPEETTSTVVRTDFSDESVWKMVCVAIEEPVGDFQANNPAFEGITVEEIVEHVNKGQGIVFVVDSITISQEEHLILAVDLWYEIGRTFCVLPSEMWSVQNNVSLANMDFWEFADSVDPDGVFRGFKG